MDVTRALNPLKTESMQTNAMVASATLHTDIMEMILMALCDFFAKRYRRAM
jgi:hypothetical protein